MQLFGVGRPKQLRALNQGDLKLRLYVKTVIAFICIVIVSSNRRNSMALIVCKNLEVVKKKKTRNESFNSLLDKKIKENY